MTELLGLPAPTPFGPFMVVQLANGVSLDFISADRSEIIIEHYAFLVSEPEFDEIFARIQGRGPVSIGEEAGDREERSSGAAGAAGRDGGRERLHKFAAGAVWFGLGGHTMKSARWP